MDPYWLAVPVWATVAALWWRGSAVVVLGLVALAIALAGGWLAWWIVPLAMAGWLLRSLMDRRPHWVWHLLFTIWAVSAAIHVWPGVRNPLLLDGVQASAYSMPYDLYLNLDKVLIALVLLGGPAWAFARAQRWSWSPRLLVLPLVLAGVLGVAWTAGLIALEAGWPRWAWLWALCNLLITCVAEEAFFRFYLQRRLTLAWGKPLLACSVAGALFGLAHFGGGVVYALLAAVAGACYGLAYLWSGRLEAAIALHFLFNAAHLYGFTYPLLRA